MRVFIDQLKQFFTLAEAKLSNTTISDGNMLVPPTKLFIKKSNLHE